MLFNSLTFVAFFPRNEYTLYLIMVIIGLVSWTGYARFTRAALQRIDLGVFPVEFQRFLAGAYDFGICAEE